jgi:pimeloyl-ACP methyl ester carboxylesterase
MNTITTKDGTTIFYKDWGTRPTVVFSHGWPLNADAWDAQMLWDTTAIALLPTIAAALDARARPGTATIWTHMPMIWERCGSC